MTGFENLEVWKSGCRLAVDVYSELQNSRDYGLRDQMQRAVVSISSNIAEGSERKSKKEFLQFYIAVSIGAIPADRASKLVAETKRIAAMLTGLITTLEPSIENP